ncbi:MAG: hypothetical protein FJZ66_06725 [Bacteroidetes bacterium]|nr:hypothetical protein [Bacteroidota bacterium]
MKFTTAASDAIEIYEDYLITKDGTKIALNKIQTVGDYTFEQNTKKHKTLLIVYLIAGLILLGISVNYLYNPMVFYENLYSRDGRSLREEHKVNWMTWGGTIILLFAAQVQNVKIRRIKRIDYKSSDLSLYCSVQTKDSTNPKERVFSNIEICKGKFEELKELRKKIIESRDKAVLR